MAKKAAKKASPKKATKKVDTRSKPAKAKAKPAKKVLKTKVKKVVAKATGKKATSSSKSKAQKKVPKKVVKPAKSVKKVAPKKIVKPVKAVKKEIVKKEAPRKEAVKKIIVKKELLKTQPIKKEPVKKEVTQVIPKENLNGKGTVKPLEIKPIKKEVTTLKDRKTEMITEGKERTRYSDEELIEFKDLILRKLESSRNELKYLQDQISRKNDIGSDDSDLGFKGLEDGTGTVEREYLNQMASRQIKYISDLERALVRIENKSYGICRETGRLISKERLRAVPHATLSIEAKLGKG